MKQLDIFGNEHEITPAFNKCSRKRYISMQKTYGELANEKCKNCKHFVRRLNRGKTYFKCALWIISNSSATDIKANSPACAKFEKEALNE